MFISAFAPAGGAVLSGVSGMFEGGGDSDGGDACWRGVLLEHGGGGFYEEGYGLVAG